MAFEIVKELIKAKNVKKITLEGPKDLSPKEQETVKRIETEGKECGKKVVFLAEYYVNGKLAGVDYIYKAKGLRYNFSGTMENVYAVYEPCSMGVSDEGSITITENNGVVCRVHDEDNSFY